jgi:deoxyhypusine synthase
MYDVYASELEFDTIEEWVIAVADRVYPHETVVRTPHFFQMLGLEARARGIAVEGIVTTCQRMGVPIYSPALGDSYFGLGLALRQARNSGGRLLFDIIGDVTGMAELVRDASKTGVVFLGGGTPKNYIQQAQPSWVGLEDIRGESRGHDYGIQITTDAPHWGGLSGCTFRESESWSKYHRESMTATVYTDATIALPLLVTALAQR